MSFSLPDTVTLNNGKSMPMLGLGTWLSKPEEAEIAINAALEMGYRHIDTASAYFNEKDIGAALKKWFDSGKIKRSDLFITTKLPAAGNTPEKVSHFLKESLKNLQVDYVDLYLIHCPIGVNYKSDTELWPLKDDGKLDMDMKTDLVALWHAMEAEVEAGRAVSIGVSNFAPTQLARVNQGAKKIKIAVNQVELSAYFQQKPLKKVCQEHNIVLTSYGSLGSPGKPFKPLGTAGELPALLENPVVKKIAANHRVTTSQVLLHFLVSQGIMVIPKSTNPARIQLNFQIWNFSLTESEKKELEGLDHDEAGRTFLFDFCPGMHDHPEHFLRQLGLVKG